MKEASLRPSIHYEYVDGVVNLHKKLEEAYEKAYEIASMCIPGINKSREFKIYVNFMCSHPDNKICGVFIFNHTIFSFISIEFDYALLFPVIPTNSNDKISEGVSLDELFRLYYIGEKCCISFTKVQSYKTSGNTFYSSSIIPISDAGITDYLDSPKQDFSEVTKLKILNVPQEILSKEFLFVKGQFYSRFTTKNKISCMLYALRNQPHTSDFTETIMVYRWFPIDRKTKVKYIDKKNAWGDCFFPLGTVCGQEEEQLYNYMINNDSQILFGELIDDKISIIGGIDIFLHNDIFFPKSLFNVTIL